MNNLIAVTIGDIKGIGINLLLKEWGNNKLKNFIIISNYNIIKKSNLINKYEINLIKNEDEIENYDRNKLNILDINTKDQYTNVIDSLRIAYKLTKIKLFIGILTLPLNKKEINKFVDNNFIDQTSFFSKLEKTINSNMVFIFKNKIFTPLTTHIELKNVYKFFKKKDLVINKIKNLNYTLKTDFKINNPKLVIAGINPHAGEEGVISKDEDTYLKPIITYLKNNNINISGPFSGDSLINKNNLSKYDAFLFTYHDQALIPFKIISNFEGVNFTSNLNIIRVSPSHGTARDTINKKIATSKGIINCFKIINKISKNRLKIA